MSEWSIKTAEDDLGEHTLILLNGHVEATLDGTGWITPEETASLREELAAAKAENAQLKAALKPFADIVYRYNKSKTKVDLGSFMKFAEGVDYMGIEFRRAYNVLNHASETEADNG